MGTLCGTFLETNDKMIVDIIKKGMIEDFTYNEKTKTYFFLVKNGIASLNMEKIAEVADKHKSSFYIKSVGDYYFPYRQIWEYKDGVEVRCESEVIEFNIEDFMTGDYFFYDHPNKDFPVDEITDAIEGHDYKKFRQLQRKWGELYLPNDFLRGNGKIEINEDTFGMIDYAWYKQEQSCT